MDFDYVGVGASNPRLFKGQLYILPPDCHTIITTAIMSFIVVGLNPTSKITTTHDIELSGV